MRYWEIARELNMKEKVLLSYIYRYRDQGLLRWDPDKFRWVLTEEGKRYLERCRRRGVG